MTVYTAKVLEERYPEVFNVVVGGLREAGVPYAQLPFNSLWIRDYMPIQTNGYYTKFLHRYPAYPPRSDLQPYYTVEAPVLLEGGNVEQNDQCVMMTDMVFKHNCNCVQNEVDMVRFIRSLELAFNRELIVLPTEPEDTLGHIDGIARFVGGKKVLVNHYSGEDAAYSAYEDRVKEILTINGFVPIDIPNAYHKMLPIDEQEFWSAYPRADAFNPGWGYYINFYRVGGMVFLPAFNIEEDWEALHIIQKCFPEDKVVTVDCSRLSMEGGLINCVTWEWEDARRIG